LARWQTGHSSWGLMKRSIPASLAEF